MTALLCILVFQMTMSQNLPSVGYAIQTDFIFLASYLFVLTLIIKTIIVNKIFNDGDGNVKLSKTIEKLFTRIFLPTVIIVFALLILPHI